MALTEAQGWVSLAAVLLHGALALGMSEPPHATADTPVAPLAPAGEQPGHLLACSPGPALPELLLPPLRGGLTLV